MSSESEVRLLIEAGESRLVEFKSQWYGVTAEGKAKFAKDVLALANSASPGEQAFLLIGIEDPERGGAVLGVPEPPTPETAVQLIADYASPPPMVSLRHVTLADKLISVLRIEGSANRPHHAARHYAGVLEPSVVYIRRDRTTGTATTREIEAMLLERITGRPALLDPVPLRTGFVGHGGGGDGQSLIARITNVVDRPVAGIDVIVDLEHISIPAIKARQRVLTNVVLQPGESREAEVSVARPMFFYRYFDPGNPGHLNVTGITNYGHHVGDRWLTARLRVYYRDNEGFLQEIIRELALDA